MKNRAAYSVSLGLGIFLLFFGTCSRCHAEENLTGPYLAWEFITQQEPDSGFPFYYYDTVSLIDAAGKPAWKAQLPPRMRRYQAGLGVTEVQAIREYPRQAATHLSSLCGLMYLDDAVVIGDRTGLIALSMKDGRGILDYADDRSDNAETLFFDRGTYRIKAHDGRTWSGDARRATFIAVCGDRLVYFNGRTLALFAMSPWKLCASINYNPGAHRMQTPPAKMSARFEIEGMDVQLDGIVYLR
jgi:hypothetical protein